MIKNFKEFSQTNEGFWDWLTGKEEKGDPKKKGEAGSTASDVDDFYTDLEEFANSGKSMEVESAGNYKYSQLVERIQTALVFLGYDLPKYGIDGYFGPETANAIREFNEATVKLKTTDNA